MRLKPSAYLILGMLRGGVSTGYAIKRAVDRSTRFFWATSFAQVYPELARLEAEEYIVGVDDPLGKRPRRAYRLSPKGSRALEDWLMSTQLPGFEFRDEGLLRLFFADVLSAEDALALVRRLRDQAEAADVAFREEVLPLADTAEAQGIRFPAIAARLGADYYSWRATWFAALERQLGEGTVERTPR